MILLLHRGAQQRPKFALAGADQFYGGRILWPTGLWGAGLWGASLRGGTITRDRRLERAGQ
jgi:hypothetical protein